MLTVLLFVHLLVVVDGLGYNFHGLMPMVSWGLTALSAQTGYIVPQRKLKFAEDVYFG